MDIEQELAALTPQGETLLTIGVFDGVHAGHRHLLQELQQRARKRGLLSGVLTFDPHPQSVLHPNNPLPWLMDLDDRIRTLEEIGVDLIAVLSFTAELAQLPARDFMSLLKKHLRMRGIVVGPDFALGRGAEGDSTLLRTLGQEMNFGVEVIQPYILDGEVVSSTLIRRALSQGDMRRVQRSMGRYFYLKGKVVSAEKRGRVLGFPTANLAVKPQQAMPADGTYATMTEVDGKQFLSATNIGIRPTFHEGRKTVETHLLKYEGDLYGKQIRVEFVRRLRDEQRFSSPEELKIQIEKDLRQVETLLVKDLR